MSRILPRSSVVIFTVVAALGAMLSACTPATTTGVSEPTQTPAPDFDGIALATLAAGTATAVADDDVKPTPIQKGGPVDPSVVSPIVATFFPERQATEFFVEMASPVDSGFWYHPSCGEQMVEADGLKMTWVHAHPPCDDTTGHDDETINFTVRLPTHEGVRWVECYYQGASSGVGASCTWLQ